MITATNGRPPALVDSIMNAMKDGRERTTSDLARLLAPEGFSNPKSIGRTLSELAKSGRMYRDTHDKIAIWKVRE